MKTLFDDRYFTDAARYAFTHSCERCAYHDVERDRCAHGYPDAQHRAAAFVRGGPRDGMFCKEFELL